MDPKYTYAFRGLIAFVAFTNLGVAVRAFVEKKCLLNEFSQQDLSALPRVYGILAVLQAIILVHCALYIHQKPLITLGIFSLSLNIIMHVTETLIFHTTLFDFRIILPCVLNAMTVIGFFAMLFDFKPKEDTGSDDENAEMLKLVNTLKKKGGMKKVK